MRVVGAGMDRLAGLGEAVVAGLGRLGYATMLLLEAVMWLFAGPLQRQPVRLGHIVLEMMEIGVRAVPIVALLAATIGVILTVQGIHTLSVFGAEQQVVVGLGIAVLREFGPLVTAIVVVARSGAAIAARLATMRINQEIDALTVMGIEPVRYLVSPILVAMLVMVPALALMANFIALAAAGFVVVVQLDVSFTSFLSGTLAYVTLGDLLHGLGKSLLFAVEITLIGVVNGAAVTGGAQGVGTVTTRSVVQGITAVIVTDMIFSFVLLQS